MNTGRKTLVALGVLGVMALSGLGSIAAHAADAPENLAIAEIVEELDNSTDTVVVVDPASLSNRELIEDKYFEAYTSVVAVTKDSLGDYKPSELSEYIVEEDGGTYPTALNILVVDNGRESKIYVASPNEELRAEVVEILGEETIDGGIVTSDPGWLILRQADSIYAAQQTYNESMDGATAGIITGIVFGSIIAAALLIWAIVAMVTKYRRGYSRRYQRKQARIQRRRDRTAARATAREERRRERQDKKVAKREQEQELKLRKEREANSATVTDPIERALESLRATATAERAADPRLAEAIDMVLERFSELRESITLMEIPANKRDILYVEYEDRLEKLVTLVGPKYYGDIRRKPDHWRDADEKLDSIRLSMERSSEQILENIRQLKEGSEFDFELVIDSILGFKIIDPKAMLK